LVEPRAVENDGETGVRPAGRTTRFAASPRSSAAPSADSEAVPQSWPSTGPPPVHPDPDPPVQPLRLQGNLIVHPPTRQPSPLLPSRHPLHRCLGTLFTRGRRRRPDLVCRARPARSRRAAGAHFPAGPTGPTGPDGETVRAVRHVYNRHMLGVCTIGAGAGERVLRRRCAGQIGLSRDNGRGRILLP
jgi:hypothetical protein